MKERAVLRANTYMVDISIESGLWEREHVQELRQVPL
jgi:hypothetical protein